MEEIGRVCEFGEQRGVVKVEIEAKGACQSCSCRNVCLPFGNDRRMVTEAINEIGACPGDLVRIEMEPKATVGAAFLLYGFPVIALFVGYALGASTTGEEKYGIMSGLAALALSFALLRIFNPLWAKGRRFKPVVVEIVRKGSKRIGI